MSDKQLIWLGAFVGSTAGGFLPLLWHASLLSVSGIICSAIGGLLGIWLAWKMTR